MELARHLLVLLHLVGFAALFGGCFVQLRSKTPEVSAAMLHGALTQLVSGLALLALLEMTPPAGDVNHVKIGIKLLVTIVITVLVIANRRYESIPRGLWGLIFALTFANAALAVLW
jgi:hypothetical protein